LKYLVTGGAGYIGVPLIKTLLQEGHSVVCLDRFFFGKEPMEKIAEDPNLEMIQEDIRWFNPKILEDIEVVIDLAALSNDPSGEIDPAKTYDINYLGRVRVAKLSKEYGVERYIIASTCSVYGFQEEIITEACPTNPLTTYAKSAIKAEKDVLSLADDEFTVVTPRFATVYGLSPRMRFDLAINAMVMKLQQSGKIYMMRDGTQWRPFIHVRDVAKAYVLLSESPKKKVNGETFNVGSNEQNYQIHPLAQRLGEASGKPYELEWYGDPDTRSYRVNFDKIKDTLGFKPDFTPEDATKEIYEALENGEISETIKTKTVQWYKHLLESEKLLKEVMIKGTVL